MSGLVCVVLGRATRVIQISKSFQLFLVLNIIKYSRPAAIPVEVKSIDDTSNFDDFPDVDLKIPAGSVTGPGYNASTASNKDWVFINYTFKRFEGLTQRGPIPK